MAVLPYFASMDFTDLATASFERLRVLLSVELRIVMRESRCSSRKPEVLSQYMVLFWWGLLRSAFPWLYRQGAKER